jgi:hypothetical protein
MDLRQDDVLDEKGLSLGQVTVFDNGGQSFDRYTVFFDDGFGTALGIGETGNVPNGFCQSVDAQPGEHLGEQVPYDSLPEPVKKAVQAEWENSLELQRLAEQDEPWLATIDEAPEVPTPGDRSRLSPLAERQQGPEI